MPLMRGTEYYSNSLLPAQDHRNGNLINLSNLAIQKAMDDEQEAALILQDLRVPEKGLSDFYTVPNKMSLTTTYADV